MTLVQSAADAARRLASAGLSADDSRRDAVLLARWRLGWTAATWLARSNESVPTGFPEAFEPIIARRARREPVAYITGEREFYGRAFRVTPDVLIPRPETELLIEQALEPLKNLAARPADGEPARALDVGTGSGCLAITLALEAPGVRIVATDVSPAALEVARSNARDLGVADRIEFRIASLADDFPAAFDLIVANPPYVPETDRAFLSPEVRDHEPAGALFAGPDGLDVIRALVPAAAAALRPQGVLMMEIGYGQADSVGHLMRTAGFSQIRLVPDLQSIPRVIMGRVSMCLFCRIIKGEIPATTVYEDDRLIAFNDINPQAPMHVLVVPRAHIATLNDLDPSHDALVGEMIRRGAAIAAEQGYADRGFRTVFNCNADAGQAVFHIHLHVLGGRALSWPPG